MNKTSLEHLEGRLDHSGPPPTIVMGEEEVCIRFGGLIEVGVGQEEGGEGGASLYVERMNAGVGKEETFVRSGGLGGVGEHEGEGGGVFDGV